MECRTPEKVLSVECQPKRRFSWTSVYEMVYICICSVFYSVILLLLWCGYGQGGGFACMYFAFYKALTHEYVPHL